MWRYIDAKASSFKKKHYSRQRVWKLVWLWSKGYFYSRNEGIRLNSALTKGFIESYTSKLVVGVTGFQKEYRQRSAESRGFSPGTPVSSHRESWQGGYVIRAHSSWLTVLWWPYPCGKAKRKKKKEESICNVTATLALQPAFLLHSF